MEFWLAFWLSFFGGSIPDAPAPPPGPTQPPAIRVSACGPSYVAPGQ